MTFATVTSRAGSGLDAPLVQVEAYVSGGVPKFAIVGLPETAVRESKDRVRAAIKNSRFEFPLGRITINLAPADLPKDGARFDLPIAIGILAASGQLRMIDSPSCELIGELSLSGDLKPIRGALPVALKVRDTGRAIILPRENAGEAGLVRDIKVLPANHLLDVCAHLSAERRIKPARHTVFIPLPDCEHDLSEVRGQPFAKRALEIAAAGGHALLMIGPPGVGKTMLAQRLPGILPPMTEEEALETAAVRSLCGHGNDLAKWRVRPFRSPHHSASSVALAGGGSIPRPGEISLAHNGVLFLDELPEYDRRVLEVLREPMESGRVCISRAARQTEFPARFQFLAAMNPCPCGYLGDRSGRCRCSTEQVQRYRGKISGPLVDRIDLHIEVGPLPAGALDVEATEEESSAGVAQRVRAARRRQLGRSGMINAHLSARQIRAHCALDRNSRRLLEQAFERLGLSARAYHRVLKVARTIADLEEAEFPNEDHLCEAINLRRLDRRSPSGLVH